MGAGAASAVAPTLNELQDQFKDKLPSAGLSADASNLIASLAGGATAAAIGAAASGGSVAEMSGLQAEWVWVKGQKNFGAFSYTPSQQFTDWVASNTGLASGTLNVKLVGAGAPKLCGNGDTSCLTGIGQQQNAPLTEAERKARAEYFGNLGDEYQRSANLAASMRLPQVALTYEIAAALTGLLEQAYEPSIGKVIVEALILDRSIQAIADKTGIPRLYVEEISNAYVKPRLQVISDAMDKAAGLKK